MCLAVPVLAQASDFCVDGIYYNILSSEDKTCEVTSGKNVYMNFIDVPSKVEYNGSLYRVVGIGDRAFYGCRNLDEVTLAEGVSYIGEFAFSKIGNVTTLTLPASMDSIANNAFNENTVIKSITLNCTSVSLGDYAFASCSALQTFSNKGDIRSIGEGCFDHCKALTTFTIPRGVERIGESAFQCCYALTAFKVNSQNAHFSAQGGVLFNKDKTTLVAYPNGKEGAYDIPQSVTAIGDAAFAGSKLLTALTIPSSVISIGFIAFNRCQSLSSITNLAAQPQDVRDDTFATYGTLHVLADSKAAYKAAEVWKKFTVKGDASDPSSVDTPVSVPVPVPHVTARDGVLCVEGAAVGVPVMVYTLDGQLVRRQTVLSSDFRIRLPQKHAYVVRIANKSYKISL